MNVADERCKTVSPVLAVDGTLSSSGVSDGQAIAIAATHQMMGKELFRSKGLLMSNAG